MYILTNYLNFICVHACGVRLNDSIQTCDGNGGTNACLKIVFRCGQYQHTSSAQNSNKRLMFWYYRIYSDSLISKIAIYVYSYVHMHVISL